MDVARARGAGLRLQRDSSSRRALHQDRTTLLHHPLGGNGGGPDMGELAVRPRVLRVLAHRARLRRRPIRDSSHPRRMGQRRPDGDLLLRYRPRNQARGRPRGAARTSEGGAPGDGGHRRDDRARPHLLRIQRHGGRWPRLGHSPRHRHRLRARRARTVGTLPSRRAPYLPPRPRRRRRHRFDSRHRRLLHRQRRCPSFGVGVRCFSAP